MEETAKRVDQLETRVSDLDDTENIQQEQMKQIKAQMQELADKAESLYLQR